MTHAQSDLFAKPVLSRRVERIRALNDARDRAEVGMDRAARRAERLHADWCREATEALRKFAAGQKGSLFLIEMARVVIARELDTPSDARAWGRVVQQAARAGYIVKTNLMAPAASSNASGKPLWKKGPKA